jgi:hypothetical protein
MHHRPFRHALTVVALALAALVPASALAQDKGPPKDTKETGRYVEKKSSDGNDVTFIDADTLSAEGLGPIGSQIIGFHPPRRFLLLRPRLQFVPEMLKTVENM